MKKRRWPALRIAALCLAVASGWAWHYGYAPFGAAPLRTPVEYNEDAFATAAILKAAADGRFLPFLSKDVPELGAPYIANWNDYPITEELVYVWWGWVGHFIGVIPAMNLGMMGAAIAAAVALYWAARRLGAHWMPAWAAGALYGLSPYLYYRSVRHFNLIHYWVVPLGLVVCAWLGSRRGIRWREKRHWGAIAVAAATGMHSPYYSLFFGELLLWSSLLGFWKRPPSVRTRYLAVVGTIFAAMVLGFALVNLDTFVSHWKHGANANVVQRSFGDIDVYAFRPIEMMIPQPDNILTLWQQFGTRYAQRATLQGEFPSAYIGVVGVFGLLWMVFSGVVALGKRQFTMATVWVLGVSWLIFATNLGGLNSFMRTVGIVLFRSSNRVSIFIMAMALLYFARRVSPLLSTRAIWIRAALVAAVTTFGLYEQQPNRQLPAQAEALTRLADSDAKLVSDMEAALPKNARVFQLPAMHFPEVPWHHGVQGYELFRPYYFSHSLRFSHGDMKGRPNAEWKFHVSQMPLEAMIAELERNGFEALYLNRKGYPYETIRSLVEGLNRMGKPVVADSMAGDSVVFRLQPSVAVDAAVGGSHGS